MATVISTMHGLPLPGFDTASDSTQPEEAKALLGEHCPPRVAAQCGASSEEEEEGYMSIEYRHKVSEGVNASCNGAGDQGPGSPQGAKEGLPPLRRAPKKASGVAKAPGPATAAAAAAAQQQQQQQQQPAAGEAAGSGPSMPRRRAVLVAKCLTNSDASSGRIILPRVAVETNLPFVTPYRHYALPVRDSRGHRWQFVIKSWANGTEHRRVFVLEQANEFLRSHGVGVGDAVGICTDHNGELVVEANTPEVRQATVSPKYMALAVHVPPPAAGAAVPLVLGAAARCARSVHCTKPAGHPGFCSGPKAAAAAGGGGGSARSGKAGRGAAAGRSPRCGGAHAASLAAAAAPALASAEDDGGSSDEAASTLLVAGSGVSSPSASAAAAGAAAGFGAVAPSRGGRGAGRHCLGMCSGGFEEAGLQQGYAELPPGLHPIADIPVGLRLMKVLTSYDLSSRHVVMPAPEVEEGLGNALDEDLLTLAAVDESQGWQFFTLRAWVNLAHRRGYLLEGAGAFLRNRGAGAGDALLLYRESHRTPLRVEVLPGGAGASACRLPTHPDAAIPWESLPFLLDSEGPVGSPLATPDAGIGSMHSARSAGGGALLCQRTLGCTKQAGHQGFCSGHKGFKRQGPGILAPVRPRLPPRAVHVSARRSRVEGDGDYLSEEDEEDMEYTPSSAVHAHKRRRRAGGFGARPPGPRPGHAPASRLGSVGSDSSCDPLLSLLSLLGEAQEAQAGEHGGAGPEASAAAGW